MTQGYLDTAAQEVARLMPDAVVSTATYSTVRTRHHEENGDLTTADTVMRDDYLLRMYNMDGSGRCVVLMGDLYTTWEPLRAYPTEPTFNIPMPTDSITASVEYLIDAFHMENK